MTVTRGQGRQRRLSPSHADGREELAWAVEELVSLRPQQGPFLPGPSFLILKSERVVSRGVTEVLPLCFKGATLPVSPAQLEPSHRMCLGRGERSFPAGKPFGDCWSGGLPASPFRDVPSPALLFYFEARLTTAMPASSPTAAVEMPWATGHFLALPLTPLPSPEHGPGSPAVRGVWPWL